MKVRKKMMWLERMIQTFRDEVDLPKTCCTHSCVKGIAKGERLHCLHFVGETRPLHLSRCHVSCLT